MNSFQDLQDKVAEWSDKQFGANRPPSAPMAHLIKEIDEVLDSEYDLSEYADCLMLLLDSARMAGLN